MTLDLDTLVLRSGTHTSSSDGVSLMEAVSALAGEPWSNSPSCTSPVIAAYARSLNDWLPDDARQRLKAYIPRLVGTAEPDLELRRGWAAPRRPAPTRHRTSEGALSARALSMGSSHARKRRREHGPDRDTPHGDREKGPQAVPVAWSS